MRDNKVMYRNRNDPYIVSHKLKPACGTEDPRGWWRVEEEYTSGRTERSKERAYFVRWSGKKKKFRIVLPRFQKTKIITFFFSFHRVSDIFVETIFLFVPSNSLTNIRNFKSTPPHPFSHWWLDSSIALLNLRRTKSEWASTLSFLVHFKPDIF